MRFLAVVTAFLALLAPELSYAGDFETTIIQHFEQIQKTAIDDENEIRQLQKSMLSYDSTPKELACLTSLQNDLSGISSATHLLSDLFSLSTIMENARDRIRVNSFLAKELAAAKETMAFVKRSAAEIRTRCDTMLVINYSQRVSNLVKIAEPELQKLEFFLRPSSGQ